MGIKTSLYNLKEKVLRSKYKNYDFLGYTYEDRGLRNDFILDETGNILSYYDDPEVIEYIVPVYLIFKNSSDYLFIKYRNVKFYHIINAVKFMYQSNIFKKSRSEWEKEFIERQEEIKKFTTIIQMIQEAHKDYELITITQDVEEFLNNKENISFQNTNIFIPTYAVLQKDEDIILEKIMDFKFYSINEVLKFINEKNNSKEFNKNLQEWEQEIKNIKKKQRKRGDNNEYK